MESRTVGICACPNDPNTNRRAFDAPYNRKFKATLSTTKRNTGSPVYPSTWIPDPLLFPHHFRYRRWRLAVYSNAKFWVVLCRAVLELVFINGEVLAGDRNVEGTVDK
jgi:hypothetical protein